MHDGKGFSILEVLIGVAIFMFGMLGVAALQISAIRGNIFSGNLSEATILASNKIEELMGLGYDDADLDDGDADGTGEDANQDGADDSGGNFGLDDACMAAVDAACLGTAQADGCDGCASAADGVGRNGIYRVYWNIAVDEPMPNCKTINVIVKWRVKTSEEQINISTIRAEVE